MVTEEDTEVLTREDLLAAVRAVRDEVRAMLDSQRTELEARIEACVNGQVSSSVKALRSEFDGMVEKALDDSTARFEAAVKALPAPSIKVLVPEQKTPSVSVNVPPAKRLRKSITYDAYGRPETIEETEV